ncbi:MAG: DNA polymerase III subunit beta [Bacteroidales bacterium]|nr:DNA polymerase III subunit beta [Bacteroidales bacterium]
MKFIVSSSLLLKNLQSIVGVIKQNNTLPILDDFLFEVKEEELKVTASDLETTMNVTLPLTKVEGTGSVAIPARILMDTLKTFADIPLTFIIDDEKLDIEIIAGEGKYKLTGHNKDEYPNLPELGDTSSFIISSSVLVDAISKTIFATGNDELRPVMSGVFCQISEDNIIFVATDAHKLVCFKRNDIKTDQPSSFIFPKKPLNQLKGVLSGLDDDVKIEYDDTNAFFSFGNINLFCRLIDGHYPNYEAVIPTNNENILHVDRIQFLNSLKRVSIFANQSTHQVRLNISGQELVLSAEDIDFSNEAKERMSCNYQGEDIEIGFNSKFLLEMVNNVDCEEITLEMSSPNRAGIIKPVDDNENEDILMLVMPVILN